MSSNEHGRRRPKPRLLRRADADDETKPAVTVPESQDALRADRVIVPFLIIEYEKEKGSSIGILMLEQAVA